MIILDDDNEDSSPADSVIFTQSKFLKIGLRKLVRYVRHSTTKRHYLR